MSTRILNKLQGSTEGPFRVKRRQVPLQPKHSSAAGHALNYKASSSGKQFNHICLDLAMLCQNIELVHQILTRNSIQRPGVPKTSAEVKNHYSESMPGSQPPQQDSLDHLRQTDDTNINSESEGYSSGDNGSFDVYTELSKQSFACPFHKHNSTAHKGCSRLQMTRVRDVKQHLKRRHSLSREAPECSRDLVEKSDLTTQATARGTSRKSSLPEEFRGISKKKEALSRRVNRNLDPKDQWFSIWDILFPDSPRPSSPYIMNPLSEAMARFRAQQQCDSRTAVAKMLVLATDNICESVNDILSELVEKHLLEVRENSEQRDLGEHLRFPCCCGTTNGGSDAPECNIKVAISKQDSREQTQAPKMEGRCSIALDGVKESIRRDYAIQNSTEVTRLDGQIDAPSQHEDNSLASSMDTPVSDPISDLASAPPVVTDQFSLLQPLDPIEPTPGLLASEVNIMQLDQTPTADINFGNFSNPTEVHPISSLDIIEQQQFTGLSQDHSKQSLNCQGYDINTGMNHPYLLMNDGGVYFSPTPHGPTDHSLLDVPAPDWWAYSAAQAYTTDVPFGFDDKYKFLHSSGLAPCTPSMPRLPQAASDSYLQGLAHVGAWDLSDDIPCLSNSSSASVASTLSDSAMGDWLLDEVL